MRTVIALLAVPLTLGACAKPKDIAIKDAYVRLAAVRDRPSAAYFTIVGGPTDRTLINVSTDVAIRTEMHETSEANGVMSMKQVKAVPVPAHAQVAFQPGGRHVMLFDVNPGVKPGGRITLTYSFGDGTRYDQSARVIAAGDAKPK